MDARIAGVIIPMQKHIVIGLTESMVLDRNRAKDICALANIDPTRK